MELAQKYEIAVSELKAFAEGAHFTDVVLGLSGGIDSSLVAVMCVDAFGAEHVHGYLLPGPYSTQHSVDDAEALARNLGLTTQTISIVGPYEGFKQALSDALGGELSGLASENTQARCRMVCLMALSNANGWMLVNTGNKSEACMGFSTLYGATAGDFAPIGGFYKTDVFALSRWVNERAVAQGQVPPIPENVMLKPPSAELSPDAKD
jgi:NAD+ synthase (glutamine-hydrolysing)